MLISIYGKPWKLLTINQSDDAAIHHVMLFVLFFS